MVDIWKVLFVPSVANHSGETNIIANPRPVPTSAVQSIVTKRKSNIGLIFPVIFILFSSVTGWAALAPPTNLRIIATSPSHMQLWWDYSSGAKGFTIERQLAGTSIFTKVIDVPSSARSYIDTGLWADTGYIYRVRAYARRGSTSTYIVVGPSSTFPLPPPKITFAPYTINFATTPQSTTIVAIVSVDGIRPTDTLTYQWVQKSGPDRAIIYSQVTLQTVVGLPKPGAYVLSFTATVTPITGIAMSLTKILP